MHRFFSAVMEDGHFYQIKSHGILSEAQARAMIITDDNPGVVLRLVGRAVETPEGPEWMD